MSTLSISSPGVQINEVDLSLTTQPAGATNVLMVGFASQGPTQTFVNVSSISEYQSIFGTPTNAAEKYLYYSAQQVLNNSPANLIVNRLPYGSGNGNGYANNYSALVYPINSNSIGGISAINFSNGLVASLSGTLYNDSFYSAYSSVSLATVPLLSSYVQVLPTTSIPSFTLTGGGKDGTPNNPAKGTLTLNTSGAITGVNLTLYGFGYNQTYLTNSTIVLGASSFNTNYFTYSSTASTANPNQYANGNYYTLGEPVCIQLSDADYQNLSQNNIAWSDFQSGSAFPSITGVGNIGNAGLIVLNANKRSVNNLFEGYYVAIADNTTINPSTKFNCVTGIKSVNSTASAIGGINPIPYTTIPQSRLTFQLSADAGSFTNNSVSQAIENYPTGYNFASTQFNDSLIVMLLKVSTSTYNQDTVLLNYSIAEGYSGSLYANRTQNNPNGGSPISYYLPNIVNQKSNNIKVYVNPYISNQGNWIGNDGSVLKQTRVSDATKNLYPSGVYQSQTDVNSKIIGNVPNKLQTVINQIQNNDQIQIDVVAEAGLGTIYATSNQLSSVSLAYDDTLTPSTLGSPTATNTDGSVGTGLYDTTGKNSSAGTGVEADYLSIANQFASLASSVRKDHVFIADPVRQIFVQGYNGKVSTYPSFSFSNQIYWPLVNLYSAINSSYVVTYGNWLKVSDPVGGSYIWLPPSGYVAANIASASQNGNPWDAVAGFTRGVLSNVVDIAVNPTQKQRDLLYKSAINPIAFFPGEGYVIYGQKTQLDQPSAFDRLNVRRLFLTLEKQTLNLLKFFVFEPNNYITQQRLVGALTPLFDNAKINGGLYAYQIVCDSRNNTPSVIDSNSLAVAIYIQPVKTAEFILCDFIATTTGTNFSEVIGNGKF